MRKLATRIIQGMVMPTGWHIMITGMNGQPLRIEGDTLPGLLEALIDYRLRNVIPLGDPLRELEEYICGTYPDFCHKVVGASVDVDVSMPSRHAGQSLLDRMIIWIEAQTKNLSEEALITQSEAQKRADICEKCPLNVKWKESCATCNDNVDRLVTVIRIGHTLPRDRRLLACQAFGHDNRAAVWLRRERIGTAENLPAACWANQP